MKIQKNCNLNFRMMQEIQILLLIRARFTINARVIRLGGEKTCSRFNRTIACRAGRGASSVAGADLVTIVRLASRNPELTGALVCSLALTTLAMLMVLFVIFGGLQPLLAGYCLVGLIWLNLSRRHGNVLPSLFLAASGTIGAIFALVSFVT